MCKLLIWGIGKRCERFMKYGYFEENIIVGFIDSAHKVESFYDCPVYEPEIAYEMIKDIDYVVIATKYFVEIYDKLIQNNIPRVKIIFTDAVSEKPYVNDDESVKKVSIKLYNKLNIKASKALIYMNESDKLDDGRIIGTQGFDGDQYKFDYFKFRTFEFIANEILENAIEGKVAEFGVFQGTFSKLINKKFKDRNLFLFDTFEGFDEDEIDKEIQLGRCDNMFKEDFKETSAEAVLSILPYPEKCTIVKGLFPASITEEIKSIKFAFVSIDVDLEESTYQGISFFFPRLTKGGVLYMHDYNSSHLSGVKAAVKRYEKDNNIVLTKVPLADACGTLVVIK